MPWTVKHQTDVQQRGYDPEDHQPIELETHYLVATNERGDRMIYNEAFDFGSEAAETLAIVEDLQAKNPDWQPNDIQWSPCDPEPGTEAEKEAKAALKQLEEQRKNPPDLDIPF